MYLLIQRKEVGAQLVWDEAGRIARRAAAVGSSASRNGMIGPNPSNKPTTQQDWRVGVPLFRV